MNLYTRILITFGICNFAGLSIILFGQLVFKIKSEFINYKKVNKFLNCCLLDIYLRPYISLRIIKKSYIRKYINLGIDVKEEGIADVLMGDKYLAELKDQLEGISFTIKSLYEYNIEISFI